MAQELKKKHKGSFFSTISGIFLTLTGAAIMVKAFDIAHYLDADRDHIFTASIALIIFGVFDLTILPLFRKNGK